MASVKEHPFFQELSSGLPGSNNAKNEQRNTCTQDREEWRLVMWMAQGHCFTQSCQGFEQSGSVSHADVWGKSILGGKNGIYKRPEVGAGTVRIIVISQSCRTVVRIARDSVCDST